MIPAVLTAGAGLVKSWLTGKREAQADKATLDAAVVEASGGLIRLISLAYLMGPEVAPLLPWVTIADVAEYQTSIAANVAEWKQIALQGAMLAIWGRAELDLSKGRRARAERTRRGEGPRDTPPGGGP